MKYLIILLVIFLTSLSFTLKDERGLPNFLCNTKSNMYKKVRMYVIMLVKMSFSLLLKILTLGKFHVGSSFWTKIHGCKGQ